MGAGTPRSLYGLIVYRHFYCIISTEIISDITGQTTQASYQCVVHASSIRRDYTANGCRDILTGPP